MAPSTGPARARCCPLATGRLAARASPVGHDICDSVPAGAHRVETDTVGSRLEGTVCARDGALASQDIDIEDCIFGPLIENIREKLDRHDSSINIEDQPSNSITCSSNLINSRLGNEKFADRQNILKYN